MIEKIINLIQVYGMMLALVMIGMSSVCILIYLFGTPDPAAFAARYTFTHLLKFAMVAAWPITGVWYWLLADSKRIVANSRGGLYK